MTEVLRGQAETLAYAAVMHPLMRGKPYTLDFSAGAGFGDVDIVSSVFGSGNNVVFDARGTPSAAGTVVLERSGRRATVTLDGLTGKITKSE